MELCIATTNHYDHKAARERMMCEEKHDILVVAKHQYIQAVNRGPIDCAGKERR